ncbi:MAG TPA: glycosyltransferase WbuB [Stellaceae bacterium]|jgi:colanic acid biosynthesis glycosyl transferase WcaI
MKILVHGLNFSPELIGIGKYTGEMAAWFGQRGHDVRVVTAPPYYPDWKVFDGHRNRWSRSTLPGADVRIYRCPVWVPERQSGLKRLVHLLSFAASSTPVALWQALSWRPDVVIGIEPALFAAPGSLLAAWVSGARAWLHVQDLEIDAAFETGLLRGDRLRRIATAAERLLNRRFDRVSSISNAMCDRLGSKGVDEARIRLVPNWIDAGTIYPLSSPSPMRRELAIPDAATVALYAGNMAEKQGIGILADVARRLAERPDIMFVFAGNGAARSRLEAASAGLANVRFLPLQPAERLNDLLNLADIHLLPQRRGVADLVLPSKVTNMMASGRPVVAGAAPDTQLGRIAARCGLVVEPEDAEAMAGAVAMLVGDAPMRAALGAAGRDIAVSEWSRDAVLGRFETWLAEMAPAARRMLRPEAAEAGAGQAARRSVG